MSDIVDQLESLTRQGEDYIWRPAAQAATEIRQLRREVAELRGIVEGYRWSPISQARTDDPDFQALACHIDPGGKTWSYYIINRHDIGGRYECWVVPPGRPVTPTHFWDLPTPPKDSP